MNADDFDWSALMCNWCRSRLAQILAEGEPLCLHCADVQLERLIAMEMSPPLRELLPALREA